MTEPSPAPECSSPPPRRRLQIRTCRAEGPTGASPSLGRLTGRTLTHARTPGAPSSCLSSASSTDWCARHRPAYILFATRRPGPSRGSRSDRRVLIAVGHSAGVAVARPRPRLRALRDSRRIRRLVTRIVAEETVEIGLPADRGPATRPGDRSSRGRSAGFRSSRHQPDAWFAAAHSVGQGLASGGGHPPAIAGACLRAAQKWALRRPQRVAQHADQRATRPVAAPAATR